MDNIEISFFGRKHANVPWKIASPYVNEHIYYVYGGTAFYTGGGNGVKKPLKKGFLYVIPYLGDYKYLEQDENDPLHHLALDFSACPMISSDGFLEIDVECDKILKLHINILEEYTPNEPVFYLQHELSLPQNKDFLRSIESYIHYIVNKYSVKLCSDVRINDTIDFIRKNYSKDITTKDLADRFNLNEKYFIALFRENTSISPHRFIVLHRINMADTLLSSGVSVSEVANAVGYKSVAAFSATYKNIKNISPKRGQKS